MATAINTVNNAAKTNMGWAGQPFEPSLYKWALFIPKGYVIPETAMVSQAAFKAELESLLYADVNGQRARLTPRVAEFKNPTDKPLVDKKDGIDYLGGFPPYSFQFTFEPNFQANINMKLLLNNRQNYYDMLLCDDLQNWVGRSAVDAAGGNGMGGYELSTLIVNNYMPKEYGKINGYEMTVAIPNYTQMNQGFAFYASNVSGSSFLNLTDVILKAGVGTNSATDLYVSGTLGNGNPMPNPAAETLGQTCGEILNASGAPFSFRVFDPTGATPATITSISYNAPTDTYHIVGSGFVNTGLVYLAIPSILTVDPFNQILTTENAFAITI
jgi:hypothetical protein